MRTFSTALPIAVAVLLLAASGGAPAEVGSAAAGDLPARTVLTDDGPLLVTPAGMTLYVTGDENTKGEKFKWSCTNTLGRIMSDQQTDIGARPPIGAALQRTCAQKYPPYLARADARATGDFSIVERPEGGRQWVYRGFPLYTSIRDRAPGDRSGSGGSVSFGGTSLRFAYGVLPMPPGIELGRRSDGLVLVSAANGKSLYTPRSGSMRKAAAGIEDLKPLRAPRIGSATGDWSIVEAGEGQKQYAFAGKPIYAAPDGISEQEILRTGTWERVVVRKAAPLPTGIGKQLTLLGDVYTDDKDRTLYTFACSAFVGFGIMAPSCEDPGDPAGYMVALCGDSQECARRWRPYPAAANARSTGEWSVVESTYPMFTDPKGVLYPSDAPKVKVWAYRGKPVYRYYEDEKPGDLWGNGIKGLWGSAFVALMVPGGQAFDE